MVKEIERLQDEIPCSVCQLDITAERDPAKKWSYYISISVKSRMDKIITLKSILFYLVATMVTLVALLAYVLTNP